MEPQDTSDSVDQHWWQEANVNSASSKTAKEEQAAIIRDNLLALRGDTRSRSISVNMMDAPDSPPDAYSPTSLHSGPAQQANTSGKVNGDGNGNAGQKVNFGAPGSSWNTKKFSEEYDRAESALLDKNWDCSKYGDPLEPKK